MDRYSIGGTSYSELMNEKTEQYNIMIRNAEITNRNNGGKPTKEEGNFYREAVNVCNEIINMNLSQRAVVNLWNNRKKLCEVEVNRIVSALRPAQEKEETHAIPESNGGRHPAPSKPLVKDSYGYVTTPSGFKTRNACKEVPAETIEKWYKDPPRHSLDDVNSMDAQKKILMDKAGNLGWDQTNAALGISPVQSFFFYGPQGTGKTFLIEAFAGEMMKKGFKFIRLLGGDIHASLVGVAEKTVQIAFQEAIDNSPCVIFVDEIENVCVNRKKYNLESHEKRLTVAFLEAYNLLKESGKRAVFLGATNFPSQVDEAMLDRVTLVPVPLPNEDDRLKFFKARFSNFKLADDITFDYMVDATDNYSYRDLGERLIPSVMIKIRDLAIEKNKVLDNQGQMNQNETDSAAATSIINKEMTVTKQIFDEANKEIVPSSKADIRAELEAFEAKVRGLQQ